jgi:hypothetical protein
MPAKIPSGVRSAVEEIFNQEPVPRNLVLHLLKVPSPAMTVEIAAGSR